jgi:oligoribonuclease (3'-5' exoribonuclease)
VLIVSCLQIVITNGNLDVVDDGLEFVVRTEKAVLDKFDSFPHFQSVAQRSLKDKMTV